MVSILFSIILLTFSPVRADENCIKRALKRIVGAKVEKQAPPAAIARVQDAAEAPQAAQVKNADVYEPEFIANPNNVQLPNTKLDERLLTEKAFRESMGDYYHHVDRLLEVDQEPHVLMGSMEFGKLKLGDEIIANQVGGLGMVINDMVKGYPDFLKSRGGGKASFVFPAAKEIPNGTPVTEFKIPMGDKIETVKVEKFIDESGAEIYFFRNRVFDTRSVNAKPNGIYQIPDDVKPFSGRKEWEEAYFFGVFNKSIKKLHEHLGSNIYHGHDHHTAIAAQHIGKDTPATVTIHNAGMGYEGRSWANDFGPGRVADEKYPQGVPHGKREDMEKLLEFHGVDFDTYMKYYEERGDFVSLNAVKFVGDHNLVSGSPVSLGYTDELKMDLSQLFDAVKQERGQSPLDPNKIYRPNGGRDLGNLQGVQNGLGANKHATIHPELSQKSADEFAGFHEALQGDPKIKEIWTSTDLRFGRDLDTPAGKALVHENKAKLKEMLQRASGLDVDPNKPMFTLVSRIVDQKNVDVLAQNIRHIVNNGGQVVIGGLAGDEAGKAVARFMEELQNESELMRKNFKFHNTFANNGLGTLIQGGGDYFVITSKFEPSGLTDIESAWLGTVPLTRKTGGLGKVENSLTYNWADTSDLAGEVKALEGAIDEAIDLYKNNPDKYRDMRIAGMREDFDWNISYSRYFENYRTSALYKLVKNLDEDIAAGKITSEEAVNLTRKVIERLPEDAVVNFTKSLEDKAVVTSFEGNVMKAAIDTHPGIADNLAPRGPPVNIEELFNNSTYGANLVRNEAGEIQGTFIKLRAQGAAKVEVLTSHDEWREGINFLEVNPRTNDWSLYLDGMKPGDQYKFRITHKDGTTTHVVDPVSRNIERDVSGDYLNSVVHDPTSFAWTDNAFKPVAFDEGPLKINPDTIVPDDHNINYRNLADVIIAKAKEEGKSSVSLVNLQGRELLTGGKADEFSLFTPNPNHGNVEDFKYLVNKLHENNINVLMEVGETTVPSSLGSMAPQAFIKLRTEAIDHFVKELHIDGVHYSDLGRFSDEATRANEVKLQQALRERNPDVIIASDDAVKHGFEEELAFTARVTDDPLEYMFNREKMIEFVRQSGMPAYLKETPHGDVPVVLVTKENYPKVKEIMENSYGALASLHPQNATDHGWLRSGDTILDLYNPSERHIARGEFHETGLAWKTTDEYFSRRQQGSKVFFDQVFPLRQEQLDDIEYLQRVRRAAFYRNPYAFYTDANGRSYMNTYFYDKGGAAAAKEVKPHMLKNCSGEHCYSYPLMQSGSQQISAMKSELKELGINYDDLLTDPNMQALQKMIREDVLAADAFNPDTFHYTTLLDKKEYKDALAKVWPGEHSQEDTFKALSFISSIPAVEKHNEVLYGLRGGSSTFPYTDFNRESSTIFFVYDEDPSAVQKFWNATYTNRGPQNSLDASGNKPLNAE